MRKIFSLIFTVFFISLFNNSAMADGNCHGPNNAPNILTADFGNVVITDPTKNQAGYVIVNAYQWALPGYVQNCTCITPSARHSWIFTTITPLTAAGDGWLKLPDYFDIKLTIDDSVYWPAAGNVVPFSNKETAGSSGSICGYDVNQSPNTTGSHGRLDLRIKKPFIGHVTIPSTQIASLYACNSTDYQCNPDGNPTVIYLMFMDVTVPQNCVIDVGKVISVDFGNMYSGDFTSVGLKAKSAKTKTFNVPVECTNIGTPANLTLRIEATPEANYPQAIKTDKENVGVVVTNNQGGILIPDDASSTLPFVTDSTGKANLTLQAYPVSTTGIAPDEGVFTALAYIRIDFA